MAEWPSSLPVPLVGNVTYTSPENAITSQLDAGPAKRRRRFTAVPEVMAFRILLTQAQVQTLQDFVAITLSDVLTFDWREFRKPDTDPLVVYRFRSRPTYTNAGRPNLWYADIELDLLTTFQGTFLLDVAPLST